jgi:hypothetical protein
MLGLVKIAFAGYPECTVGCSSGETPFDSDEDNAYLCVGWIEI